jgi:indolepyruvate ferredoxin oxidoreductase
LTVGNHELAVRIASLPDTIRGYDLIKDATAAKAEEETAQLLEEFRSPEPEKEPELAGKR